MRHTLDFEKTISDLQDKISKLKDSGSDKTSLVEVNEQIEEIKVKIDKKLNDIYKKLLDIGDIIGLEGTLFTTKVGEMTVLVKTFKILNSTSFIVYHLTGKYVIDHLTAVNFTPLYDIKSQCWSNELSNEIIDINLLPEILWSNEIAGEITEQASKETGLKLGEFSHYINDAHIYENHIEGLKEQLTRGPFPLPSLEIADKPFWDIKFEDFTLKNYQHHPAIKFPVAV